MKFYVTAVHKESIEQILKAYPQIKKYIVGVEGVLERHVNISVSKEGSIRIVAPSVDISTIDELIQLATDDYRHILQGIADIATLEDLIQFMSDCNNPVIIRYKDGSDAMFESVRGEIEQGKMPTLEIYDDYRE